MRTPIDLPASKLAKLQQYLHKSEKDRTIMNNSGDVIRVNNIGRFVILCITDTGHHLEIEYEHDDPAFLSPATMRLPKVRLGMYMEQEHIEALMEAGLIL